jgi:hypothetical protein
MNSTQQINSTTLQLSHGETQPRSGHNLDSRKRKHTDEMMASRPPGRRPPERPVPRVAATPAVTVKFAKALVQGTTDLQYRALLQQHFPEVSTADLDYDKKKSAFHGDKNRTRFINRAAYNYLQDTQNWLSKCFNAGPNKHDIPHEFHRMELSSLMLQRIFQEYAVEVHQKERGEAEAAAIEGTRRREATILQGEDGPRRNCL